MEGPGHTETLQEPFGTVYESVAQPVNYTIAPWYFVSIASWYISSWEKQYLSIHNFFGDHYKGQFKLLQFIYH